MFSHSRGGASFGEGRLAPQPAASSRKISKSSRASPTGSATRFIAIRRGSVCGAPMSSRSSDIVAGSTMSANRAIGVQALSWQMMVSTRAKGLAQAVEVLMVMERVAAGPVDQLDIRIGHMRGRYIRTVRRPEQHVADRVRPG
jgi:hypothetical protein